MSLENTRSKKSQYESQDEPDDRKAGDHAVGETSRSRARHDASDTDEIALSEDDIIDAVDLDAISEGEGPDA